MFFIARKIRLSSIQIFMNVILNILECQTLLTIKMHKIEFPPIYWRVHENFLNYLYANHKKNIMNFDVNKSVPD